MKNKALFTSNSNEWYTPQKLFDKIEKDLGFNFTLDPCATKESAKCKNYYTEHDNGIEQDWGVQDIFINPPYSRGLQPAFINKALEESKNGARCVLLIPARTDTKIWHNTIFPYASKIYFINGRVKFSEMVTQDKITQETKEDKRVHYRKHKVGDIVSKDASTFPSAIIVFESDYSSQVISVFDQ